MASTASGDSQTSFIRRQGELCGAAGLIGLAAYLGVACATWTVSDPSLSQSNQNMVENWAGPAGAVVADLAMQIFGLGAALLVALPAIWGLLFLSGLSVDHIWRRAWYALAGIVLASAALGCLPAPAGWPLPIGLGGVAGDIVLKFPALATGAYPSGFLGFVFAVMIAAPAGWLFLNGAGLIDRNRARPVADTRRRPVEDEDEEAGESRVALAIGALAHTAYSVRSSVQRHLEARRAAREPAEFGDRFDDWQDDDFATPQAAQQPQMQAGREIRVAAQAETGAGYHDPMADYPEDDGMTDAGNWQDDVPYGDEQAAYDGSFDEPQPALDDDAMVVGPADRVSPNAAPIPEENGGWRGLLAGNIVAFPGRKAPAAEAPRSEPRGRAEGQGAPARPPQRAAA
ncbi:MAG: DNA translocase FtsK 4TM domain-containing protein, partial [Aurantimonas coralicida]